MTAFICLSSGPSLNDHDCDLAQKSGLPVIAVNSSWKMAPWCQHIYAGDHHWWQTNREAITSKASLWCGTETTAQRYGIKQFKSPLNGGFNSGQRAILLAFFLGASKVILLGYDCSIRNGLHWHEDHGNGLKNPDRSSVLRWRGEFERVRQLYGESRITNCSRFTELTIFPQRDLEEELAICRKSTSRACKG